MKQAGKHINDLVIHTVVVFVCHIPIPGLWKREPEENVLLERGRELSKNVYNKVKIQKKIDFMKTEILPCHCSERSCEIVGIAPAQPHCVVAFLANGT